MDSFLMRLSHYQNRLPAKIIIYLMVVCFVMPLAPGSVAAETMENDETGYLSAVVDDGSDAAYDADVSDGVDDGDNSDSVDYFYTIPSYDSVPLAFLEEHIQYIFGYPDGTVRPDNSITRAEAAVIFHRLLTGYDNDNSVIVSTFTDLGGSEWYYQSVAFLEKNGIIYGYPDGTFRPDATITRAEFAALVSRLDNTAIVQNEAVEEADAFDDVTYDYWAYDYINSAASKGWVSGNGFGQFQPEFTITRAQVVTILNRITGREIRSENIPVDAHRYIDLSKSHWAYCAIIEASDSHEFDRMGDGSEVWLNRMMGL